MQMFDLLKKTVSSTVNSVIGNPVCREYEIGAQVGNFGPGSLWKIYDGRKKSTGQDVSVFVFEKKILEKMERRSSELVLETMKAGPTNLTRLRHPRLLVVQHPLEESRDSLAFATEPVFASLANILGNHQNFAGPIPKQLKDHELYDVEKVYGLFQLVSISGLDIHCDACLSNTKEKTFLLGEAKRDIITAAKELGFLRIKDVLTNRPLAQAEPLEKLNLKSAGHVTIPLPLNKNACNFRLIKVVEGLIFLHNDAKRLHGNLTTESVVITRDGQWKIAGLYFSKAAVSTDVQLTFECRGWDSQLSALSQPELNYTAPEHVLSRTCNTSSDLFSLGVLIYAIYNGGKPLFNCQADIVSYKRQIEKMSRGPPCLDGVPSEVQDQVKCLLSISPELRPDAHQIAKASYFDNVAAQTLHYLDTLMQRDNMTKSQFFKSLDKIISMLPKRVVIQRVLPHLCLEFSNHAMLPFVLPNVLLIAESCTNEEYNELIFPKLKPVLKIQDPIQIVLILLKKMDLLLTKTPKEAVQFHVLPMVFQALEAPSDQVQELALTIIPSFAKMIEYSAMKHSIIPRIKTLCLKTNTFTVRINCLVCLGKILEFLDKYLVIDEIFPVLAEIPTREPAVCMAILGIYKQTMIHKKLSLDKDYIARKALPFLLPLAVEPGLNISQFGQFMSLIRDFVSRVETEQKAKLEQLKQMQDETKSSLAFAQEVQESKEMDDVMGKVTNLFAGNAPQVSKEKTEAEKKNLPNGSAAFNKFFGFSGVLEQSKNTQELSSLSVAPQKTQTQLQSSQDPFGSTKTSSVSSKQFLKPSSSSMAKVPANTTSTSSLDPLFNPSSSSSLNPYNTSLKQPSVGYTAPSNSPMDKNTPVFNTEVMPSGARIGSTGNFGAMPGYASVGMSTRQTGPAPRQASFPTSTMPVNSMSSLNSIEIPGFPQNPNQKKSLNQMTSSGFQQPLQVSTGLFRPVQGITQPTPLPSNQSFNAGPTPLPSSQNTGNPPANSTDLLDIFG